ncbi:MAG: S9 family peptidase, partial [Caldimonas sp.]
MTARKIAPYGSWVSALGADRVASATLRLGQIGIAGDTVYWTEGRPQELGRNALVRAGADGVAHDVTAAPWNVRTRVHEYGGGAFALGAGEVFFSHDDDQRLYRQRTSSTPIALTVTAGMRYADAVVDTRRARLIAVREDHSNTGEPVNALVAIDLASGAERVVAGGHDFCSNPCLSPDGRQLAWLAWDHPNMPWDRTELWLAELGADGLPSGARKVAGGRSESIFQPLWSPAGALHFVSDRSGWWNLYRERGGEVEALCPMAAEFGRPQWVFGMRTYGFDGRGRIVCIYQAGGASQLAILDPAAPGLRKIETPYTSIRDIEVGAGFAAFFGGSATAPEALVRLDLESERTVVLRSSGDAPASPGWVARAEAIVFAGSGGAEAHAYYYAPRNDSFEAPPGELPPLLVIAHGGPTGATDSTFRWS